jgi:hypothetical protein
MKSSEAAAARLYNVSAYFEPDILAPFQFAKANRRRDHLHPEEKLMFAVLADAIECFQKYISATSRRGRKIFNEAESWIMSGDNLSLVPFEHVCEALGLDPSYLRRGLTRWRADHQAPRNSHKPIREPLRYQRRLGQPRITV